MGLSGIAKAVILGWGWRKRLIALFAGASGALALPPLDLWPLIVVPMAVAVWLIDGAVGTSAWRRFRAAFAVGWWWGFGFFLAGLWWIGAAFLVETDEFAWAMPLGVFGLPALLAFFHALAFALARLVWSNGAWRVFALAFGFGVAEALRHVVLTGFPWNTYGQALGAWLPLAQAASLIGAEGLTLLAVLVFAAPATLADEGPRPWRPLAAALAALALLLAFGMARLTLAGGLRPGLAEIETVPGVRFRLVQPNMSQRDKIAEQDGLAVLARLLPQVPVRQGPSATGMADATHIVWPESPFPFLLADEPRALAELGKALPVRTVLLTGAVRRDAAPRGSERYYNSLLVFGEGGRLLSSYDKTHLVPFGEYLPLEGWLTRLGLRRFVHAPGAFSLGEARTLMEVPGLPPVLPLICYEAIFPHEIVAAGPRPGLMVNITNDAWFGETFGPHQHLAQARLRAVEFGLPLARAANTGISAMIDPYGRQHGVIGLGIEGVADVALPKALTGPLYSSQRETIAFAGPASVFLLALVGPFVTTWRRKRADRKRAARSGE